jgi:RNA polymerase-associated protein RTF1
MDESDSDEEAEPERPAAPPANSYAPYYPLEGRFRDEADRTRIMQMSERDRERILAEREEEVLQAAKTAKLRGLVDSAEIAQAAKKRKAGAADLDDGARRASKPKTALDSYKQARADRSSGVRKPTTSRKTRRSSTPASQKDADGESEVDFDDGYRAAPREQPVATAEEFQRVRIGRDQFAQYSCYPVFEELTTDAFVRVQVSDGKYRMAQIKSKALRTF